MYFADILEKYSEDNMIESNSENATADSDLSEPEFSTGSASNPEKSVFMDMLPGSPLGSGLIN